MTAVLLIYTFSAVSRLEKQNFYGRFANESDKFLHITNYNKNNIDSNKNSTVSLMVVSSEATA